MTKVETEGCADGKMCLNLSLRALVKHFINELSGTTGFIASRPVSDPRRAELTIDRQD